MANWITAQGLGWIGFLLIVNILLLLAGNVMEPSSIIVIMAPILFPVAMKLGIDPIHFGILITVNMEVGLCHPPVGLNLYVASGIAKMGITELTIAVWPWLLTMLGFLVDRHLRPGDLALAAQAARHDVIPSSSNSDLRSIKRDGTRRKVNAFACWYDAAAMSNPSMAAGDCSGRGGAERNRHRSDELVEPRQCGRGGVSSSNRRAPVNGGSGARR